MDNMLPANAPTLPAAASFPTAISASGDILDGIEQNYAAKDTESSEQSMNSNESAATRKLSSKAPLQRKRTMSITTRVGLQFFLTAVCVMVCAFAASAFPDSRSFQAFMWLTSVATCALIGMTTMRTTRTLQTIESELNQAAGEPEAWKSVRPIIGSAPITHSWNELLQCVGQSQIPIATDRNPAELNHEVVTLARAMRGLPVAWVITDRDGRIRFISPAACGLLALDEANEHAGKDLLQRLGLRDDTDESVREIRQRLLSDLRMVRERHTLKTESLTLQLRIRRSVLEGRSGDGQGLAWILTDVTQQDLASRSRDQFLMTATHELRTPLGNLQAYAEALQLEEDLEVEQQKEFCNVIVSEANRLGRLVDQLLTVGQMEAGSMVAVRNELEMLPMVQYSWDQMTATAEKKSQSLLTDFAAKLPTVFGDREKLQAALVNLVGNAVKYTPDGGEIIVRCGHDDEWIRVSVQDNGPGIPADEQSKVFDKFYRGSNTVDLDERGNGLGLAFTREVARMHGGDIDLESTIGEGSTFTMRLPVGGQSRSGI
ncbi:sensor histidine kinase [Planctomycetes bacterium K23_9]|uniref:histidine kinase n=1 Tax=Stieleria marina TaxID=1930275 RepID=A0A517NS99_9BACT|nr:Sensor histidine kinase YycG [Planctomycetes bacterium K23_9]